MTSSAGNPWRRTASREVYRNAWFSVREDQVIRPYGSPGVYGVVELPAYAGVVPVREDGKVALIKQWRYHTGKLSLEIPAGNAAPTDASPQESAQRELKEETGLTARTWLYLGRIDYSAVTNPGRHFLATNLDVDTTVTDNTNHDDWTELLWTDYTTAIQLVIDGEMTESTSVTGLLLAETARLHGRWNLPAAR